MALWCFSVTYPLFLFVKVAHLRERKGKRKKLPDSAKDFLTLTHRISYEEKSHSPRVYLNAS